MTSAIPVGWFSVWEASRKNSRRPKLPTNDSRSGRVFRLGAWNFFCVISGGVSTQNRIDLFDQLHEAVGVFLLRGLFAKALPPFLIGG